MQRLILIIIALVLTACSSEQQARQASVCPDGRWLIANIWAFGSLPASIRQEIAKMMIVAMKRDSMYATNPNAYRGDAVSRTVGPRLRDEVEVRAPVNMDLEVFYRDPKGTAKVVYNLGILPVKVGIGSIRLPEYAGDWIVEVVLPSSFDNSKFTLSPVMSGGKNRLWIFPEEWEGGKWCSLNFHVIVP